MIDCSIVQDLGKALDCVNLRQQVGSFLERMICPISYGTAEPMKNQNAHAMHLLQVYYNHSQSPECHPYLSPL